MICCSVSFENFPNILQYDITMFPKCLQNQVFIFVLFLYREGGQHSLNTLWNPMVTPGPL